MKKSRKQRASGKQRSGRTHSVRRIVVGSVGGLTLSAGIMMIVLPGPALVFIPLGLGILSTEFKWARSTLEKGIDSLQRWASGPKKPQKRNKATRKENVS